MKIVIFDFDGTLTKRDTLRPFANYLTTKQKKYYKLFIFYLFLLLFKLRLINDRQLKETFLRLFIKNTIATQVESVVSLFLEDKLANLINDTVFEKFKNHATSGDNIYLASANFDFFLTPLIKKWNLKGVIATETEKNDNYFTGKIIGNTCKGKDKVRKIRAVLGDEVLENAITYGNSEDKLLLNSSGRGFIVS